MDIKELRIGNYIEMDKNVFSLNYIDHREIKDYLPIKITEEKIREMRKCFIKLFILSTIN